MECCGHTWPSEGCSSPGVQEKCTFFAIMSKYVHLFQANSQALPAGLIAFLLRS